MIQETIVTTQDADGKTHIAPMGIHASGDEFIILPFKPSTTLDNILKTKTAIINYSDDVRIFAGCLTGHYNWPLKKAKKIDGYYLSDTLAHCEVALTHINDDPLRPKLFCKTVHQVNHSAFKGYNRAQFSVRVGRCIGVRPSRPGRRRVGGCSA